MARAGSPPIQQAYGAEMARDLVRLLDHLKIPRAHIVGFSMGASIAGHMLTTNADRFLTATFVGYHPVYRWTPANEREAEASARELEGETPFKSLFVALTPPGKPLPSDDEISKAVQPLVAANDLKALAGYNRGRSGLVVTDQQLAAVRVPTLGIIGTADPSVGTMRDMAKMMPALKLVVVEGAEHGGERGILRRREFMTALRELIAAHH